MKVKSCVAPTGDFVYGIHKPSFKVKNLRENDHISNLGEFKDNSPYKNLQNFPEGDVNEPKAGWIFEIPNPFPFRGTTYITKKWAEEKAGKPELIRLPTPPEVSFTEFVENHLENNPDPSLLLNKLPTPLKLALATTSTDANDLIALAKGCCEFLFDESGEPAGLIYEKKQNGRIKAAINDEPLFEALANNPHLPDNYKNAMVLKPGVQGGSEIIGEWNDTGNESHIFEYLRRNSYIPWGHYAANMANDSIRYSLRDLTFNDMKGLRHLYYQRTYVRLASELIPDKSYPKAKIEAQELEETRLQLEQKAKNADKPLQFNRTLWGWNFGFDFAPTHYRLHASHQQIHQQFAMVPTVVGYDSDSIQNVSSEETMDSFACGDLIASFAKDYQKINQTSFFDAYLKAIKTNRRMDNREDLNQSLIVYEDESVMVFVPKAQTSQWELQMMTVKPVGNILEADLKTRKSLDKGMYIAVKSLSLLGAKMITSIEFSKQLDHFESDQRLLYSFLPRLPESPGAFSEAQLRWINGHYPEDFATACRNQLCNINFD